MGLDIKAAVKVLHTRGFSKRLLTRYVSDDNSFETLDNSDPKFIAASEKCEKFVQQFKQLEEGTGLVIVGSSGTGKSLLMHLVCLEIFKQGAYTMRMTDVDGIIKAVNDSWTKHSREAMQFNVYAPSILVIDDFPQTLHQSRDVADVVHKIYRQRYERGKYTFITARCDKDEMSSKFGTAFASFLSESAILVGDLDKGDDYRQKIRPKLL